MFESLYVSVHMYICVSLIVLLGADEYRLVVVFDCLGVDGDVGWGLVEDDGDTNGGRLFKVAPVCICSS